MTSEEISGSEKLFRNLHPTDFDNGRVNSTAFNPSANHRFKLSVDRSSLIDAKGAYENLVSSGCDSIGVCSVLRSDFSERGINCFADPIKDNKAHALADFSPFGSGPRRKKARELANIAGLNGFDFQP